MDQSKWFEFIKTELDKNPELIDTTIQAIVRGKRDLNSVFNLLTDGIKLVIRIKDLIAETNNDKRAAAEFKLSMAYDGREGWKEAAREVLINSAAFHGTEYVKQLKKEK